MFKLFQEWSDRNKAGEHAPKANPTATVTSHSSYREEEGGIILHPDSDPFSHPVSPQRLIPSFVDPLTDSRDRFNQSQIGSQMEESFDDPRLG